MALFLRAKQKNKSIFLEPNEGDKVQKAVDVIASVFEKDPDDVALVYQGKHLNADKTFKEQSVSHPSQQIVEPLRMQFIFKEDGQWQEPETEEEEEPEEAPQPPASSELTHPAPEKFPTELVKPDDMQ